VTGNSASGSKYYDLSTPVAGEFGPDPLDATGKRHYANSVENQEHVRTYVKVGVKNDRLVIENIRSGTCAAPNAAVELGNVPWCGPNSGASAAQPVGSLVDKVTVYKMAAQTDGTVGGSVPATLSLTLGSAPSFGAFTAGVAKDYTAQTSANVISTAGDAGLSVADPSSTATGHLVNGTFSLPSTVQANAGGPFADVGGSAAPTLLKSWTNPTSNEAVTVNFQQHISAGDALRTGTYAKTLTFTLSTTTP
jgi:hypothetical protein